MGHYDRKDRLYRQAKEEGYRSRAAYKLIELQDRLKFLRPGMNVLDLGCFPGGWCQVASKIVGERGRVVGVDLRFTEPFPPHKGASKPNVFLFEGDVTKEDVREKLLEANGGNLFDLVLSDMSPNLTGINATDEARIAELIDLAFSLNRKFLRPGGIFVAKAFPSQDIEQVFRRYKTEFSKLDRTVLKSSRQTSNEFYFIGKGFGSTKKIEKSQG